MNTKGYDSTMIDWEYERLRCKDYEKQPGDPMTEPKERPNDTRTIDLRGRAVWELTETHPDGGLTWKPIIQDVLVVEAQLTALRALLDEACPPNWTMRRFIARARTIIDGKA